MASITNARVVKIKGENEISINIPASFLESTMGEEVDASRFNHAVIIFTPSTRIIKIYPSKSDQVARIEVEIGELTPEFLQDVSSIFLETSIKTLYSTGVCFTSEACLYEVYADKMDLPSHITIDELKNRLKEIRGVSNVKIDFLSPDKAWEG